MSFSHTDPFGRASPCRSAVRHVAILLTTFNGARFLSQQLDSILGQDHTAWTLYISDDGSTDDTLTIIESYQRELGAERVRLFHGPRRGFAQNFLSLIRNPVVTGDYFAFSDQDDRWFPDKLSRSLNRVSQAGEIPAFYCSRTRLVDEAGHVTGLSPRFQRMPGFRNALVQSLAGANTMVLNSAARELLARVPTSERVVSHDWLCYLLVSGCGGHIFYDPEPTLDYRQHASNLMGSNSCFSGRLVRIRKMFEGTFREWNQQNLQVLRNFSNMFDAHNRTALVLFERARDSSFFPRLYLLWRAGVYRQTGFGNIGLIVAASVRRI